MTGIKRRLGSLLGPQGLPGPEGLPGLNAVPADEAIASYINSPTSQTRTHLDTAYLQATSIRRIVASDNPNEPLEDGDLLLVYKSGDTYYENFANGLDDWTSRYNPGAWSIADESTATDGIALRMDATHPTRRRALTWDVVEEAVGLADTEIVARVKVELSLAELSTSVMVRGSGAPGEETMLSAGLIRDKLYLYRNENGPGTAIGNVSLDVSANTWHWVRLRASGAQVMAKAWPDTGTEPDEWMVTGSVGAVTEPGWVGVYTNATSIQHWDTVGVGTGGKVAPRGVA